MNGSPTYYDHEALLQRLSTGIQKRRQEVIFLVGAPLSSPLTSGAPGVPGVDGVIDLIRKEFEDKTNERAAFDREITKSGTKRYQAAFAFLQGRRGQPVANEIVRRAAMAARIPGAFSIPIDSNNPAAVERVCQTLDVENSGWHLNPGMESLGKLITDYSTIFGKLILTTNFDPLIEASIQRAGGNHYRTSLYSDANLSQTQAPGCHVIHLHGFWHGSDTLHTPRQLGQPRPHLRDSLRSLLRDKVVAVVAYGGWDDVFTEALMEIVRDLTESPEVLWTFHAKQTDVGHGQIEQLGPGIDRGRVNLYAGIDCNRLFPALYEAWLTLEPTAKLPGIVQSNPVQVSEALSAAVKQRKDTPRVIEGNDEDHPPLVDICVGRETELYSLKNSEARVVFLTGMGGQGKSTVAAQYFAECQNDRSFSIYVWRDCKEERARFENQLSSVIETLSEGRVSGEMLVRQSPKTIIQLLLGLIKDQRVLFAFDNVDHYVELETGKLTGSPDLFVRALLDSDSGSRAVFTCRPVVDYEHAFGLSIPLEGISLAATNELFVHRGASSTSEEISDAYQLTNGHAFWLDLLAIQIGKNPSINLKTLIARIGLDTKFIPEKMLNSVWALLTPREQTVLRAIAETLRPETEMEIVNYLSGELTYHKVVKALKNLRSLNLVVIKKRPMETDLLELHPLVRHFVRHNFQAKDRLPYINRILAVYHRFITGHKSHLKDRPSLLTLQYWTQSVELDIAAGRFKDAFSILSDVARPFAGSGYPREFTKTALNLFETVDWQSDHAKFSEFEYVFRSCVHFLAELGEVADVDALLEKYDLTIQNRDARFISYCDLRCYSKWARGDFPTAVAWGRKGYDLKISSGVDTHFDIFHSLALAERDAGRPESALTMFLYGRDLAEVTDPEELDEKRDGHYYGNIGRCLHLMGQLDGALTCYQKSALLLEKTSQPHILNEGYIRQWIAELLIGREQFLLALVFLRAAFKKWEHTSPPRAIEVSQIMTGLKNLGHVLTVEDQAIPGICLDWILGKNLDATLK